MSWDKPPVAKNFYADTTDVAARYPDTFTSSDNGILNVLKGCTVNISCLMWYDMFGEKAYNEYGGNRSVESSTLNGSKANLGMRKIKSYKCFLYDSYTYPTSSGGMSLQRSDVNYEVWQKVNLALKQNDSLQLLCNAYWNSPYSSSSHPFGAYWQVFVV